MPEIRLYPKQAMTLTTPATEILYGGAAGGGKSHLLRAASIIFSMEIPGLMTYLFRRTFKELLSNHIYTSGGYLDLLKDLIDTKRVVYSKSDYSFSFINGSRIQLAHSQYPSDIFQYQGAQIHLLLIDEATHFTEDMVRFLRSRMRLGSLEIPKKYQGKFPRIVYGSNPGGIGHKYFKRQFVDQGTEIYRAPLSEGGMLRQYIPALLTDNVTLMINDPHYSDKLRGLGDNDLVEAMLSGNWETNDQGAIPSWNPKTHVVKPFPIPVGWKIRRGYDYGYGAPYAVLWFVEANGEEVTPFDGDPWSPVPGSIFIVDEIYGADRFGKGLKENVRTTSVKIKDVDRSWGSVVLPGPADTSIFNREQGPSIAEIMSDNGVSWVPANKKPGSRVNGLAALNAMVYEATKTRPEKPCFYVFNTCVHTADQLAVLESDQKNLEDVDTTQEDHIYDVVRYIVLHVIKEVRTMKVVGF